MSVTVSGKRVLGRRRDVRVEQIAPALDGFTDVERQRTLAAAPPIQRLADGL